MFRALLVVFTILARLFTQSNCNSSSSRVLLDAVPYPDEPLFLTYTTGSSDRISLTQNLLRSVSVNSPKLAKNAVVACFDDKACRWCRSPSSIDPLTKAKLNCYCIEEKVETKAQNSDNDYNSPVWSAAVLRKVQIALDVLKSGVKFAFLVDHDVVIHQNIDNIADDKTFMRTPIVTMCDFPKYYRPQNRMANTGFIIINFSADAKRMVEKWYDDIQSSNVSVNNDQPPFQEIAKLKEFAKTHRCADEEEGFGMWFHKKGKISGSGLSKNYYFSQQHKLKVFHANDIEETAKKVQLFKRMGLWYMNDETYLNATRRQRSDANIVHLKAEIPSESAVLMTRLKPTDVAISRSGCQRDRFFMYDWPVDQVDLVPSRTESFSAAAPGRSEATSSVDVNLYHSRRENFGAGVLLDAAAGQFNTYMHSLFPIVYRRLLIHPSRTTDPSNACHFFIPYDITSDSYYHKGAHLDFVIDQLTHYSAYFQASNGSDHFFIDSSEPFWYEKKSTVSVFYKFCRSCLKLTPSTLPVPYQKWQRSFPIDNTYVHIPYTSTWHYFETQQHSIECGSASKGSSSRISDWAWDFDVSAVRENLICFVGIIKKMSQTATQLRRHLAKLCKNYDEQKSTSKISNILSNLSPHDARGHYRKICLSKILSKSSWKDFGDEARLYRDSTFCLLPTGDIPSRKAIFDMMIAGCIPVIFDMHQIDIYKWHIDDTLMNDMYIYVDLKESIDEKKDIIKILMDVSWERIVSMRGVIKRAAFGLQYALPPLPSSNVIGSNIDSAKCGHYLDTWKPPRQDALEIILSKLFNRSRT